MSKILTSIRLNSYWREFLLEEFYENAKNAKNTTCMYMYLNTQVLHYPACNDTFQYHTNILYWKQINPSDWCVYILTWLVHAGCFVTSYQPIKTVGSTMEWSIRLPLVLLEPCLCMDVFRRINLILGYSSSHVFQFYLHKLLNNTFEVNFPRGVQQNI